jgi:hypothetical protein
LHWCGRGRRTISWYIRRKKLQKTIVARYKKSGEENKRLNLCGGDGESEGVWVTMGPHWEGHFERTATNPAQLMLKKRQ